MTTDSDDEGRLREVNHHGINERERIGDDGDSRDSPGWAVQVQQHRQQPQGSAVRWERFLHVRSIKVLLVENDDSTRHVVTALLRNSNYEVVQAANGLQAWKILEDQTNHIDLVLTEVVMPGLSGIGLLCKIMSHNLRKHIPVITMSSHDSMALVFKCLSKGAVDFLVKPIRKNELKNLWQHIWRRCHSSSGSGSESGAQTQKSVKSKSSVKSENGSSSNEAYDNRSASLKVGDGSEDGSGTQTSWTRQAVEVQSSPAVCSRDQTAESPDNTCAIVIHSNAEVSGNKWVPMTATRQSQEQEVQLDHAAKGKEFVSGKRRKFESQSEGQVKLTGTEQNTLPELEFTANSKLLDKRPAHTSVEYPLNKYEAVIANNPDHQMNRKIIREPALEINNTHADDSKELPGIELSLKKLRGVEDAGKTVQSDRNVLRRSELSAFSRYNTISSATNVSNVITENSSQLGNTIEIVKKEYIRDIRSHSDRNILQPGSDGVSNNIDVGSITNKLSTDPVVFKSEVTSTSSAFIPMRNDFKCPPQEVILVKTDDMTSSTKVAPRGSRQELPVQHIHHHHHVHHYHNMEREHLLTNHDDFSLKKLAADSPHCGSSNVLCASGSKHGSNNQNGSSTAANAEGTNVESDIGLAGKNGDGNASGSGSGNMIDLNKSAQREAALTKSCQKRKERCFQKKVRYQNRKRQAEEQSRVRGLYVRQTGHDSSNSAMDD